MTKGKQFRKLSDVDYGLAFDHAFRAAAARCDEYLREHPDDWFPCGFAWVVFDGRDPAVKFLKRCYPDAGRPGYPKGFHVWNPAASATQCMEAKIVGARAFVEVLKNAGVDCHYESRWD